MCKETFNITDLKITPIFYGEKNYQKISYPIRVGIYSIIETDKGKFYFDLNREIKFIEFKKHNEVHPNEFLKRTLSNEYIFYFSGEYYGGIYDAIGEYYVPCFTYSSNNLWNKNVIPIIHEAQHLLKNLRSKLKNIDLEKLPNELQKLIKDIIIKDELYLKNRSRELKRILDAEITVMPPDTRHVDYEVIPIIISKGCLYHCRFCRVKTKDNFYECSRDEILNQIILLKKFYGENLKNVSSIYLGLHDALNVSNDKIRFSIEQSINKFNLENSYIKDKCIFLFGSVTSFLNAKNDIFEFLNSIPNFKTYINIGLESFSDKILKEIGKPLSSKQVEDCFDKILEINKKFFNIEITSNFLFDLTFPEENWEILLKFIRDKVKRPYYKGAIYLSPLNNHNKSHQLRKFMQIKRQSFLPMYLYVIQRF